MRFPATKEGEVITVEQMLKACADLLARVQKGDFESGDLLLSEEFKAYLVMFNPLTMQTLLEELKKRGFIAVGVWDLPEGRPN
jgi:DNA-binding transcriptional regulator YhcF (GntR family)